LLLRKHIVKKDTPAAQLSVNPSHTSGHIVHNLITRASPNEETAGSSSEPLTEGATGGKGENQDVKSVEAMVVALRVLWLPHPHHL
jgi:hypothetical protein